MSGPHCLHLLPADAALGVLLGASELPSALCSGDCESEITYCLGCLRAANERNWDAGVDVAPWGDRAEAAVSGVHLFDGDALAEGRYGYPGGYVAVCSTLVRACSAPGEGADPTYCTACVHTAVRWNAEVDSWSVAVR